MSSIKNKYEFYKGFLEALGAQDVKETEYKNEEELRKKILDTMGVEYVFDDVNQTDLFRGKFLEGLANSGGGGESDFEQVQITINNASDHIVNGITPSFYDITTENFDYCTGFIIDVTYGVVNTPDAFNVSDGDTVNYTCYILANKKIAMYVPVLSGYTVSITGNGEYIREEEYTVYLSITGNCTINIAGR